jgi:hypothetical protein
LVFASHLVSMTSLYCEQARIQEGRSAIRKLLNFRTAKSDDLLQLLERIFELVISPRWYAVEAVGHTFQYLGGLIVELLLCQTDGFG